MPKPSDLPEWATGGTADIIEPSSSKKSQGVVNGQGFLAETYNWLQNLIYTWLVYFEAWTDGHDHLDDGTDGSMPRVSYKNEVDWTNDISAYAGSANGYVQVAIDNSGEHRLQHQPSGATVTSYEDDLLIASDSVVIGDDNDGTQINDPTSMSGTARVHLVGTVNAGHTAGVRSGSFSPLETEPTGDQLTQFPLPESLHRGNLPKALYEVTLTWNGSSFDETVVNSYNINAASSGVVTGAYAVYIQDDWTEDFFVQATINTAQSRRYLCHAQPTSDTNANGKDNRVNILVDRWDSPTASDFNDVFAGGGAGETGEIFTLTILCF